ncbi:neurotensin/neuromedin N [Leucoraja erinacea]|uniref:neurotensin/neuromedin N n=1 Tax=Leucoraja erinaceus TaxID=7782 RepID=UPI0024544A9B|nr:neurotensin/neuromedin N [Leucoraja erinacea]
MKSQTISLLLLLSYYNICSASSEDTEIIPLDGELLDHLYTLKLFQADQDYADYEDSKYEKENQMKRRYPYILKRQARVGKSRRPYILKRNSVFLMN